MGLYLFQRFIRTGRAGKLGGHCKGRMYRTLGNSLNKMPVTFDSTEVMEAVI